ncbi:hypothetical protein J3A83DRAFT_4466444 [Scleroderma citrinum]
MGCILSVLCRKPPVDPNPILPPKGIPLMPPSPAQPFLNLSSITSLEFLREVCPDAHANTDNTLHSSFGARLEDVIPQRNGFMHIVLECYNECHALTIRPDDVWIAVITQFSCFLNGNADASQSLFVLHDGKKKLSMDIYQEGREDLGLVVQTLIKNMKEQIQSNIVNPEFMQIEKLKEFSPQTTTWYQLLCPILSRFVDAFQESNSAENLEFWSKVAHFEKFGSHERQLSRWITAFMVFNEGQWKGDYNGDLILGGTTYPRLDGTEIPAGYAQVDVTLQREIGGPEYMTLLIAGSIGTKVFSSGDETLSDTGKKDSARPTLGWWWVLKNGMEPQDSTLVPSDKLPWWFVDADAFMSSGAIRIVSFEDISDLDFVAISYVWTDGIKK